MEFVLNTDILVDSISQVIIAAGFNTLLAKGLLPGPSRTISLQDLAEFIRRVA